MPWIEQYKIDEATGLVKKELEKALKRAGRVWNIVQIMSQNGRIMKESMELYGATMFADSPLSRQQREMLAVVVSKVNDCFYWTQSHAHDLRAEVTSFDSEDAADAFVHAIARDWREADLDEIDTALCLYAEKLTLTPSAMTEADIEKLRAVGLDDRAIHDATQVIAYFNYINRVADALDVEPETFIRHWGA
jgi:uncharacterized peroxidase-related enzyme